MRACVCVLILLLLLLLFLPDGFNKIPISYTSEGPFLLSGSAMHGKHLTASIFQQLCIFYGFI